MPQRILEEIIDTTLVRGFGLKSTHYTNFEMFNGVKYFLGEVVCVVLCGWFLRWSKKVYVVYGQHRSSPRWKKKNIPDEIPRQLGKNLWRKFGKNPKRTPRRNRWRNLRLKCQMFFFGKSQEKAMKKSGKNLYKNRANMSWLNPCRNPRVKPKRDFHRNPVRN